MPLINLAKKLVELKDKNLMSSDAFQTAANEFLKEREKFLFSSNEYKEADSLFTCEIKKYLQAMESANSWKDFKEKYKEILKFR